MTIIIQNAECYGTFHEPLSTVIECWRRNWRTNEPAAEEKVRESEREKTNRTGLGLYGEARECNNCQSFFSVILILSESAMSVITPHLL